MTFEKQTGSAIVGQPEPDSGPQPVFAMTLILRSDGSVQIPQSTTLNDTEFVYVDPESKTVASGLALATVRQALGQLERHDLVGHLIRPLTESLVESVMQALSQAAVAQRIARPGGR